MKPLQDLNDSTSLALNGQTALGYKMPLYIPFYTKAPKAGGGGDSDPLVQQRPVAGGEADTDPADAGRTAQLASMVQDLGSAVFVSPMQMWLDTESEASAFELPFDPIISVSGSNTVVKRNVAKKVGGGTVKEFWTTNDYSISISGVITAEEQADCDAIVWKLRQLCTEGRTGINVACPGLNDAFDIYRVVVESFDFPFTAGIGNQEVTLNCVSDEMYELFIPLRNA